MQEQFFQSYFKEKSIFKHDAKRKKIFKYIKLLSIGLLSIEYIIYIDIYFIQMELDYRKHKKMDWFRGKNCFPSSRVNNFNYINSYSNSLYMGWHFFLNIYSKEKKKLFKKETNETRIQLRRSAKIYTI